MLGEFFMNRNFLFLGVLLVLGAVAVSGCTSKQPAANTVAIQNNAFVPSTLHVQVGTTVMWINKDPTSQDVVSDSRIFDSGNLANGQSYNYTFNITGSYRYHSSINPSMNGTIVVYNSTNNTGSY
jgi:plastocyanin